MPAEWERHRGTWLSWPHNEASWPGRFEPVAGIFADLVRHIALDEEVHINVSDAAMEAGVRELLNEPGVDPPGRVFFHHNPTNDAWCRDHGPIFIQRRRDRATEQAIVDWGYNAWGGKYPPWDLDDVIPSKVGREYDLPVFHPGIVMEGGSIDVNGKGSLITTESCLLNPNRNPLLDQAGIERYLRDYLGVTNILWLGDGIEGDDTDGHVDDITRFVDPETIVTVMEDDPRDSNHKPLLENRLLLDSMRDQDGDPFRIVELPMPRAIYHDGQRVPASYANFYITNGQVLMPAYDPERDNLARQILQDLFTDRKVVPFPAVELAWGLGALHCVTQQWPELPGPGSRV